ncbi:MAG: phosphopantetheine adenylyltransferase [Proteobacteria bacterium]|nr:MAG: phosphopantetheine adenylyltransferase [Pseudomonadota bacterium]
MKKIIAGLIIIVGIIHVLPVLGVMGADRIMILYGVEINDPNLEILMRHRAILFGLLGLFIIYAAFKPVLQPLAIVAGFVSVLSFLVISVLVGDYNDSIDKVVMADIVALVALCVATVLYIFRYLKDKKLP